MGFIISQMYKVGALTGGVYGVALGMHKPISNGLYGVMGTSIDDIVNNFPFFVKSLAQTPVEVVPYALLLYAAVEGGGKLAKWL